MIFTSRHLSRRNFQLFDSQSTVNSQQSTVNIMRSATGIDIIYRSTADAKQINTDNNSRSEIDI
ncbi:hypothetical protein QT995_00265 [Microcoleus sp. S36b_A3]|uniref:hypothetical protein n=1 Tax=Microcoleus sp. S36bC1 TaxID=2818945 RepID=UPI002FD306F6